MQQIKEDPWTYRRKVERKYVNDILTYFVWSKDSHIVVRDGQRSFGLPYDGAHFPRV